MCQSHFQLAQGNRSVNQNQTINGVTAEDIVVLAKALIEAAPTVSHTEEQQTRLKRISSELELFAQPDQFEEQKVRRLLILAREILTQGAGSALGTVLISVLSNITG